MMVVRVSGPGAAAAHADEAGGHRVQQVSGTRVHSSTVTVVVMAPPPSGSVVVREADLEWRTCRGSGAGGQHRNKRDTAVEVVHLPSGVSARSEAERSQHANRRHALEVLTARLAARAAAERAARSAGERRAQAGSGERSDKRRTLRYQDGTVVDHPTGRRWRLRDYLRGEW